MTRHWHFWVASAVVALALVVGLNGLLGAAPHREAVSVPATEPASPSVTVTPSPTPTPSPSAVPSFTPPPLSTPTPRPSKTAQPTPSSPSPTPSPTPTPATGPPPDTLGTPQRYRSHYDARYLGWDELIERGRPLPEPTAACSRSWRNSGKDSRLDWSAARYWCLSSLNGRAYKPQGVAGSATAEGYQIGGRPASDVNLVLISWYSRVKEEGRFTNSSGESATKLTVIDLDRRRYNTVELVRPDGSRTFQNIDSHGSGMVWAGQYLYSSSLSVLWMYNADDLMMVNGRFVLPAVARWSVGGKGGMSSISLDRSTGSPRLSAINYTTSGKTYIQTFPLSANGRLSTVGDRRSRGLSLRSTFGGSGTVHSTSTITVPGSNFQGVARTGPYAFANSSALKISGRKGKGDATVVLKEGRVIKRLRMPRENVESIYLDSRRGMFTSVTEHGAQFLFIVPLVSVITVAER